MWDWIARGKSLLAIGASLSTMTELVKKGLPIDMIDSHQLKEGAYVTSASANAVVVKNPPHPNATKVYLNYVLSKEGQTAWSRVTNFGSRRTDVPTDHLPKGVVLKEGVKYIDTYKEDFGKYRNKVRAYVKSIL